MKVKELIKILKKAPSDIDVDVFNHDTDYLQKIDCVWVPCQKDMKDNPEVQLEINKGEAGTVLKDPDTQWKEKYRLTMSNLLSASLQSGSQVLDFEAIDKYVRKILDAKGEE